MADTRPIVIEHLIDSFGEGEAAIFLLGVFAARIELGTITLAEIREISLEFRRLIRRRQLDSKLPTFGL